MVKSFDEILYSHSNGIHLDFSAIKENVCYIKLKYRILNKGQYQIFKMFVFLVPEKVKK